MRCCYCGDRFKQNSNKTSYCFQCLELLDNDEQAVVQLDEEEQVEIKLLIEQGKTKPVFYD